MGFRRTYVSILLRTECSVEKWTQTHFQAYWPYISSCTVQYDLRVVEWMLEMTSHNSQDMLDTRLSLLNNVLKLSCVNCRYWATSLTSAAWLIHCHYCRSLYGTLHHLIHAVWLNPLFVIDVWSVTCICFCSSWIQRFSLLTPIWGRWIFIVDTDMRKMPY